MSSGKVDFRMAVQKNISKSLLNKLHRNNDCKGTWALDIRKKIPYNFIDIGIVNLSEAPFVTCSACGISIFIPGFEWHIHYILTSELVLNSANLSKPQLRFLRKFFDLTQVKVAGELGLSDKQYVKCESDRTSKIFLSPDKTLRLKFFYAHLLGTMDAEVLYKIAKITDRSPIASAPTKLNLANDQRYIAILESARKKLAA